VATQLPGTVRVVVLRGAGRSFSAGLDRSMFAAAGKRAAGAADTDGSLAEDASSGVLEVAGGTLENASAQIAEWQRAFDWTSRADLVSVAVVQGHAIGAGFQLALGADIRILAEDAQLRMAEPALGLVPDLGGTKRLVDLVGYSRAAEICLTTRSIGADEALRLGLASHVVANEGLDAAVERIVEALLAVPRESSAETKALLLGAARRTQDEQQAAEREAQYRRLRSLAGFDREG
jgi:enoyl-CoA hydratase/carnithine racemase